jgi:hypothetical protein
MSWIISLTESGCPKAKKGLTGLFIVVAMVRKVPWHRLWQGDVIDNSQRSGKCIYYDGGCPLTCYNLREVTTC